MALVTLQTMFQDAFPAYEALHPLPAHVRKAARALRQCRTAALGGHTEQYADCGLVRIAYNSCRNRHCPKCQGQARAEWLAARHRRWAA